MAADPSLALQIAIHGVLTAATFHDVRGDVLAVGIYDSVPDGAEFPYVTIGEAHTMGDLASGYDGSNVSIPCMVWSREPGRVEVKLIAHAVRTLIAPQPGGPPPFALAGHQLVNWSFQDARPMQDLDGLTSKCPVTVEYLTRPTA